MSFEHFGNPKYEFVDQVKKGIDETAYRSGGAEQRASIWIFESFFRPIVLIDTEPGAMIVDRNRNRHRAVRLSRHMMFI